MAEPKPKYASATALRRALEDRLSNEFGKGGKDIPRLRKQIAFDRLLARLFIGEDVPWMLKGGYAMEIRIGNARGTRDIDLALKETALGSKNSDEQNQAILSLLNKKAQIDLGDFFEFKISEPVMDLDAAPYGGARFHIEARMDNRVFEKFLLDVGVGDVWIEPLEEIIQNNFLDFAGVKESTIKMISREQQFAEKFHAYTLPREGRTNSRVKDLVDMILLIDSMKLDQNLLTRAIQDTFTRRRTHSPPKVVPSPPDSWTSAFEKLADECAINPDIDVGFKKVEHYLRKILGF